MYDDSEYFTKSPDWGKVSDKLSTDNPRDFPPRLEEEKGYKTGLVGACTVPANGLRFDIGRFRVGWYDGIGYHRRIEPEQNRVFPYRTLSSHPLGAWPVSVR